MKGLLIISLCSIFLLSCGKNLNVKSKIEELEALSDNISESFDTIQSYIEGQVILPEDKIQDDAELIITARDDDNTINTIKTINLADYKSKFVDFSSTIPLSSDQSIHAYIIKDDKVVYETSPRLITPFDKFEVSSIPGSRPLQIDMMAVSTPFMHMPEKTNGVDNLETDITDVDIENTAWQLIPDQTNDKTPISFILNRKDKTIKGNTGCNRFIGQYLISKEKSRIAFSYPRQPVLASCNDKNNHFNKIFTRAKFFAVDTDSQELTLSDSREALLATFVKDTDKELAIPWFEEAFSKSKATLTNLPKQLVISEQQTLDALGLDENIGQLVDFDNQRLLVFVWQGSGQDILDYEINTDKIHITFRLLWGITLDLRYHQKIFIISNNVTFNKVFSDK